MKVLWLSMTSSLYDSTKQNSGYNGCGWIYSLQEAILEKASDMQLGIAFLYPSLNVKLKNGNITYYPIYNPQQKRLRKLCYYWSNYNKETNKELIPKIQYVIQNFKPDVIHLFGTESQLAVIVGNTEIPIIAHLQGLLNPCVNSFYPTGMNKYSFLLKHFSIKEWLLRNGYIFAEKSMKIRSRLELKVFKNLKYVMGRTDWDMQVTHLLAPEVKYFHVDEVLRNDFYQSKLWEIPSSQKFIIVSTISKTVYKGLDLILKTAKLLKESTNLNFEWRVIGMNEKEDFILFFEKNYEIESKSVNIKYMGVLDAPSLCENLHQSHVYVHPSYIDNSPNSVCEAQLIGMPVIATNVGGISSLIKDGENGILIPTNAPFELAYQLQELSKNKQKMMLLGQNAYNMARERHSKDRIVKALLGTYSSIKQEGE